MATSHCKIFEIAFHADLVIRIQSFNQYKQYKQLKEYKDSKETQTETELLSHSLTY